MNVRNIPCWFYEKSLCGFCYLALTFGDFSSSRIYEEPTVRRCGCFVLKKESYHCYGTSRTLVVVQLLPPLWYTLYQCDGTQLVYTLID